MPVQKSIDLYTAEAIAGDLATPAQAIYTPINFTAETIVTVGNFVFPSAINPETMACNNGTGQPLGLLKRDLKYYDYNLVNSGTLNVPAGEDLTIAVKGDFWVNTSTNAIIGDSVFADLTTGAISTAAKGTSVAGSIETNWVVKTAGSAGDLIIISNWS